MEDRGCRGRPRKRQVENSFKIRRGPAAPLELADTSGPKSGPSQSHTSGNKDSTMHEEVDQKTGSRCSGRVNQSLKHPAVAEGPESRTIMGQECGARCRFHTFGATVLQTEVEIGSMLRNSSLGLKDRNDTLTQISRSLDWSRVGG